MPTFFTVSHNTLCTRGYPWGQSIRRGLELVMTCYECAPEGRTIHREFGEVDLELESRKGVKWPDVLGNAFSLFTVSHRVLDAWREAGISIPHHDRLRIVGRLPRKLDPSAMPEYSWLDGYRARGCLIDYEASGFVNRRLCPNCGTGYDDVSATHQRQHSGVWPMAIIPGSWNGADVFTSDLSPAKWFCTDRVVECAARHRLTNFRFVPIERAASSYEGIKYM